MTLEERLAALIAHWNTQHEDWCCTKGCSQPTGTHVTVVFDEDPASDVVTPRIVEERTCPGTCNCPVGQKWIAELRQATQDVSRGT